MVITFLSAYDFPTLCYSKNSRWRFLEAKFYKIASVMFRDVHAANNSVLRCLVTENSRPYEHILKSFLVLFVSVSN